MHDALEELTNCGQCFLSGELPGLGDTWWEENVVQRLTFHQRRIANERGFNS